MAEPKEKEKAEFKKILADPAYKKLLNLTNRASIVAHLGITPNTFKKWKDKLSEEEVVSFGVKDARLAKVITRIYQKALEGKNPLNARVFKELLEFVRKQGESGNREPNATDYNIIAIRTRDTLRKEFTNGRGSCPVCGQPKTLHEPCEDTRPEQRDNYPMGTVAVPA